MSSSWSGSQYRWRCASSGAGVLTASAIALFGILLLQDHRRRELLIAAVIVTGLAGYSSWDLKVGFDVGTLAPAAVGMVALLGRGVSPLPPTAAAERSHHIECAALRLRHRYRIGRRLQQRSVGDGTGMGRSWRNRDKAHLTAKAILHVVL